MMMYLPDVNVIITLALGGSAMVMGQGLFVYVCLFARVIQKILLRLTWFFYTNSTQNGVYPWLGPPLKAAATRYVVNEPISVSECHDTMTWSGEPCTCTHTLLVTRTGANEYDLTVWDHTPTNLAITSYMHNPWHGRYFLNRESPVQHNRQCISWLYIDSTKEFRVKRCESISKQNGCI